MGKGKKKPQTDLPIPSVATVIQKKGAGKPKCTSSEIDDIFGVAKSASAAIPLPAPSMPDAEKADAGSSPQQKKAKRPKTSSSTAPDEAEEEEEEEDITDDLKLLAERIRKNRQDKADKVLSDASAAAVSIAALRGLPREKLAGDKDDIFGAGGPATGRKRTEEGYAIYKEDELGLTKKGGGDTADCPFDCDCCF